MYIIYILYEYVVLILIIINQGSLSSSVRLPRLMDSGARILGLFLGGALEMETHDMTKAEHFITKVNGAMAQVANPKYTSALMI